MPVPTDMSNRQAQFDALARSYSTDLYRYAVWLCRDPALAEDLVQETFMRAWRAIDKLREVKAAKGWLITILRREYARTFERKRLDIVDVDEFTLADLSDLAPDERTQTAQLRAGMMSLDSKYREPLLMQVLGGFSCEEIADLLGISKSAVMTQLFRARQQLKARLGDESDEVNRGVS